jgi:hypothetical protein
VGPAGAFLPARARQFHWRQEIRHPVAEYDHRPGLDLADERFSDRGRAVSSVWQVVATGDFVGSGTADILWRNTADGSLSLWFMSGGPRHIFGRARGTQHRLADRRDRRFRRRRTGLALIGASSRSGWNAGGIGAREIKLAETLGIITFLTVFNGFTVHYFGVNAVILSFLAGMRAFLSQLGH